MGDTVKYNKNNPHPDMGKYVEALYVQRHHIKVEVGPLDERGMHWACPELIISDDFERGIKCSIGIGGAFRPMDVARELVRGQQRCLELGTVAEAMAAAGASCIEIARALNGVLEQAEEDRAENERFIEVISK